MEFYTLEHRNYKKGVLDAFHYVLFHGVAEMRERSRENPAGVAYSLGEVGTHPLEVTLGGVPVPPIFMPETNLIVCQTIRDRLARFNNLVFLPVVLKKLVDIHFPKGDFPYTLRLFKGRKSIVAVEKLERVNLPKGGFRHLIRLKRVPLPAEIREEVAATVAKGKLSYRVPKYNKDLDTWIRRLPDVPELHAKAGAYYEVITARLRDIEAKYDDLEGMVLPRLTQTPVGKEEFRTSERMLEDYPLFWWGFTIVSRQAFEILGPNLDRDFFAIGHYKDGKFGEWDGSGIGRSKH